MFGIVFWWLLDWQRTFLHFSLMFCGALTGSFDLVGLVIVMAHNSYGLDGVLRLGQHDLDEDKKQRRYRGAGEWCTYNNYGL